MSVVQAFWSSQSAAVAHGSQPGIGSWVQPRCGSQPSTVQAFPSSQLRGVPGSQPAAPPQISAPLHALPSSQSAEPPSSIRPSQLLSTPSHTSAFPSWMCRTALPAVGMASTADTLVVSVKSLSPQPGVASAETWIVSVAPLGRYGSLTWSGLLDTTVGVTLGSSEVTVTVTLCRKLGKVLLSMTTPLAMPGPSLCTVEVNATGVVRFTGTVSGVAITLTDRSVPGRKGQLRWLLL